mmetsp:Transcript_15634/g.20659  ORF Transcript_15634/g.20659 Transcript_15634/m.20659 type:complete len:204 (+) Transcript_15634:453-1064(+)
MSKSAATVAPRIMIKIAKIAPGVAVCPNRYHSPNKVKKFDNCLNTVIIGTDKYLSAKKLDESMPTNMIFTGSQAIAIFHSKSLYSTNPKYLQLITHTVATKFCIANNDIGGNEDANNLFVNTIEIEQKLYNKHDINPDDTTHTPCIFFADQKFLSVLSLPCTISAFSSSSPFRFNKPLLSSPILSFILFLSLQSTYSSRENFF